MAATFSPPPFAVRTVLALRQRLRALTARLAPPELILQELIFGVAFAKLLNSVTARGLPDRLERAPATVDVLARELGFDERALHRALRGLSAVGVFTLRDDGTVENNYLSRALLSSRPSHFREFVLYWGSRSNVAAWNDLDETLRTGVSAFERVHGQDVWSYFSAHPDEEECFARAMMGLTLMEAPWVAETYPFHQVRRVCDVGGGRGTLLAEILTQHPGLEAELYDAAGVLASARTLLAQRGVLDRVTLTEGSFFVSVPRGADCYLLKNILHDWSDTQCLHILRNVRAAAEVDARLVIVDAIVEPNQTEGIGPLADLQMMVVCEGRERSRSELLSLLDEAGFRPGPVHEGAPSAILEARAR